MGSCDRMDTLRVILTDHPRLLSELVRRAIEKNPFISVIAIISSLAELQPYLEDGAVDWLVYLHEPDEHVEAHLSDVLSGQHNLRILSIAADGSQADIHWVELRRQTLNRANMVELISLMQHPLMTTPLFSGNLPPGLEMFEMPDPSGTSK